MINIRKSLILFFFVFTVFCTCFFILADVDYLNFINVVELEDQQRDSSSETDPQIIEMPARKMAVVYTKGDPNVVAQQAMPALYGSVMGLGRELAKKGIKFQMQAPCARWPNIAAVQKTLIRYPVQKK